MKWKKTLKQVFGSLSEAGRVLGVEPHTVQNWRHGVPPWHQQKIIEAAKERGFNLTVKNLRE